MNSHQLRQAFTSFFEERGHTFRPSASLIPTDPTLLLTNAGMVPFKPYFLGDEPAPWARAVSIQKVVRTVDIDIIGTTQRHLSFFEMMGNFSFGDYFKEDAIRWSFEFSTEVMGLDPDLLWFTVYDTDDEARQIWVDSVGVPPERVQAGGKDNFWQMGVPGPCGPSSELFVDRGPGYGDAGGPVGGGEDRYFEFWNLVFMQNIQDEPYHVTGDLPAKSIDTGMGLDRMAAILQGVPSVFDIDTTAHVRAAAEAYTGLSYGDDERSDISLRILADHGRTVTFLIGDGVIPSNDGRGYVLRRVLRRAVRHAWLYGGEGLVLPRLVSATAEAMGDWYNGLVEKQDFILEVVEREEERFRRTLESGHQILDAELTDDAAVLSGPTTFKLHDTYGFPVELTEEIAAERGIPVDRDGFEAEMNQQRERARAAWKGSDHAVAAETVYRAVLDEAGLTEFVGYSEERSEGVVLAMIADGDQIERADEGREVEVFVDRTPFYAESGGQVGDVGVLESESGAIRVDDTQHAIQGLHGHRGIVTSGHVDIGQRIVATIDSPRRDAIRKSHTGTHVLHWALRDVLGEHAAQAGSLVEPGRLRFDFSHFSQMDPEELSQVETEVNRRLIANAEVSTKVTSKEEAEAMGAIAFFGDKYGEIVRVVSVGNYSTEFCGGTHTDTAGEVGPLIITSEASIGSNLRRVDALTGLAAYERLSRLRDDMDGLGRLLKTGASDVPKRVEALLEKNQELEARLDAIRSSRRGEQAAELAASAGSSGEVRYIVRSVGEMGGNELRDLALGIRDKLAGPAVVVVAATNGEKGALVGLITKDLIEKGMSAAELIGPGAAAMGGGGSRDPELAQAGGPDGSAIDRAIAVSQEAVEAALHQL